MEETARTALKDCIDTVKKDYEDVPDGEVLFAQIKSKLMDSYNNPPREQMTMLFQQEFSPDQVRKILFEPLQEDVQYYAAALNLSDDLPEGHPFRRLGSVFLTMIFLVHRKSWNFLSQFVRLGGLEGLVRNIGSDNLYERGQSMEIFLNVIDCDNFDWFEPNPSRNSTAEELNDRMLGLSKSPHFVSSLFKNRKCSYPGGSLRALQIIAFYLSWLRALYTTQQRLKLSSRIIEELRCWSEEGENEEETQLASTMLRDFGHDQFLPRGGQESFESNQAAPAADGKMIESLEIPAFKVDEMKNATSTHEASQKDDIASSEIKLRSLNGLKLEGNNCFGSGNIQKATECYLSGIQQLLEYQKTLPDGRIPDFDSTGKEWTQLLTTFHYNLASSYWKAHERGLHVQIGAVGVSGDALLKECQVSCREVLSLNSDHLKAQYRLGMCHLVLGEPFVAWSIAKKLLDSCGLVSMEQWASFQQLRRKAVAAILLLKTDSSSKIEPTSLLSQQALNILSLIRSKKAQPWSENIVDVPPIPPHEKNEERSILATQSHIQHETITDVEKKKKSSKKATPDQMARIKQLRLKFASSLPSYSQTSECPIGFDEVRQLLTEGHKVNNYFRSLEEVEVLHILGIGLRLLQSEHNSERPLGTKLISELRDCQSIATTVIMSQVGNEHAKALLARIVRTLDESGQSELVDFYLPLMK